MDNLLIERMFIENDEENIYLEYEEGESMNEAKKKLKIEVNRKIGRFGLKTFEGEKALLDTIDDLLDDDNIGVEQAEESINKILKYFSSKEKMLVRKNDMEFLKSLSEQLKLQTVRATDRANPILFIAKDGSDKDIYFLTRKGLNEYLKNSHGGEKQTINVYEGLSIELERLLDIIKRNY